MKVKKIFNSLLIIQKNNTYKYIEVKNIHSIRRKQLCTKFQEELYQNMFTHLELLVGAAIML